VLEALKPIAPQEVKTENSYTATATATTDASQTAGATAGLPSSTSAQAALDSQPQLAAVLSAKCATCHDAESPAGGLNLTGDVAAIDRSRWLTMLTRVTSSDADQRMPKDAEPLSDAELLLFVKALGRGE
jgi:cytochrome c553